MARVPVQFGTADVWLQDTKTGELIKHYGSPNAYFKEWKSWDQVKPGRSVPASQLKKGKGDEYGVNVGGKYYGIGDQQAYLKIAGARDWSSVNRAIGRASAPKAPKVDDIIRQYTGGKDPVVKPDKKPFSEVLSYEDFYNPQRQYIVSQAQKLYRPEFEKFTLNPFERQAMQNIRDLTHSQSLSGRYRFGKADTEQQLVRKQQNEQRGRLEQNYGSTIQNVLNNYRQSVVNPEYARITSEYELSPNRNFNPNAAMGQYKNNAKDYLDQYLSSFQKMGG